MMFKNIDESPILIKLIQRLSTVLARQRGLPIVIGLILFAAGGILEFLNLALESSIVAFFEVLLHNLGVIVALVGILLAEPLGQ